MPPITEKWEYLSAVLGAEIEDPDERKQWGRHHPKGLTSAFNRYGEQGWEIIHIEPVILGGPDNEVTLFAPSVWGASDTHYYLVVFKRRKVTR